MAKTILSITHMLIIHPLVASDEAWGYNPYIKWSKVMAKKALGKVTHYFDHLGVAVIQLAKGASLKKSEKIQFKGNSSDFTQEVGSLQVDNSDVDKVKAGDDFGLKVDKPVKEGDQVYSSEK